MLLNLLGMESDQGALLVGRHQRRRGSALVFAIVAIASNRKLMGDWTSSLLARIWGWLTFVLMGAAAVGMFVFWNQQ